MPTNDFLPMATGSSANVISQAQYLALTSLLTSGFQTGTINSAQVNKVWRQSSIMAAVLAQFIVDISGANATDDGTTATLLANLKASVNISGALQYADGTGTPDAIAASYPKAIPSLTDGYALLLGTSGPNTSTVPTFTPTIGGVAQTTRSIVKFVGGTAIPLGIGDLQGVAILTYDLPNTRWVLVNVPSAVPTLASIVLTNVDITLNAVQYASQILLLSGTLTGNVNLILPRIVGKWTVVNTCTGAFTVTAKTAAGSGYVIPNGANGTVYGNGTSIDLAEETAAISTLTDPTLTDNSGKTVSSNWAKAAFARLAGLSTQIFRVANAVGINDAVAYGQVSPLRTAVTTPLPASGTSIVGVSHSLGYVPSSVDLEFTCVTSEGGYSPGDVVKVRNMSTGTVAAGISIWATATQVGAPLSSGGWSYNLLPKTGGAAFVPTPANWSYNFVVR